MDYIAIGLVGSMGSLILMGLLMSWYYYVRNQNRIIRKFVSDFIYDNDDLEYVEDVLEAFHKKYEKLDDESKDLVPIHHLWDKTLKGFYN